ncbi:MAG: hypothetical protein ABN485_00715, partial [Pantoea agglomerans]
MSPVYRHSPSDAFQPHLIVPLLHLPWVSGYACPVAQQSRRWALNILAIMGAHGVFYKDEPLRELDAALNL